MAEESFSTDVDSTPLGERDLSDTIRELTDLAAKWRNIGILLGILDSQLDAIQKQGDSLPDCLRQMLTTWLRRNYAVERFGEPTWVKLVEAVKHPAGGGNPSLAMEIARRHRDLSGQHEIDLTPLPKRSKSVESPTGDKDKEETQIRKLQQEKEELQQQIRNLQQQLQEYKTQVQEKDAVIEAKERELRELNRLLAAREQREQKLQGKIQHLRQNIREIDQIMQQPTVSQNGKLSLSWQMCKAAPHTMLNGSSTVCGNMAYFRPYRSRKVLSYNSHTEDWSSLDCPRDDYITLAVINGLVTAVGGSQSGNFTNTLLSLKEVGGRRKWVEHFPPMKTKRGLAAVVCCGKALVVAGGRGEEHTKLTTVEVMNTDTLQWSTANSLPHPLSGASATVCRDSIYLMGKSDERNWVVTCSLNALLQSQTMVAVAKVWHRITDLPMKRSTCVTLNEQLLAVGGRDSDAEETNNIYSYNTESNYWEVTSHMPTARCRCLVAVLTGNKLMVVGGETNTGWTDKVEISTVQ